MKLVFTIFISAVLLAFGQAAHAHNEAAEIRYVQQYQAYDAPWQQELKVLTHWQQFSQRHPSWHVIFNEGNSKPHRAYGNAIAVGGADVMARTWQFMAQQLEGFNIPAGDLELVNTHSSAKYDFVNFRQLYQGLEIINSRLTLKFTKNGEVILFGLDVFNDINLSTMPAIGEQQAILLAQAGLHNVTGSSATPQLKVLAIPGNRTYNFKLVREIFIDGVDHENVPERWEVLVDAQTGELLSRRNLVVNISAPESQTTNTNGPEANGNLTLKGTIFPVHPFLPNALVNLPHLQFSVNGTTYFTDANGVYDLGINNLPQTGTFPLQGRWSRVVHGNSGMNTPTFTLLVDSLRDSIHYDGRGTTPAINSIRHLSAYYHTSLVHDYMKSVMPNFTALDIPLTTRVDRTDGTCNAFFNGNSINFYTTAGGCNALSMVADVVYHEYGHAITNYFYSSFGQNFQNGGMGEGYSDIFAITLNNYPVLGIGFSATNPNTSIRRYDINPKIFPQNLVGQVHADGEIICGAWYRTAQNIGNEDTMMAILGESMYGLANAPNGQEGSLYTDILIDAIQADDNDNNLSNGTPHFSQIVNAFAFHGISLLSNVNFTFTPVADANQNQPINIATNIVVAPPFDVFVSGAKVIYRLNNAPMASSDTILLTAAGGNNYTGSIPAQPRGTVIRYFAAVTDLGGNLGATQPAYATDPASSNLHFNILVGFTEYQSNTFEVAADDNLFTVGWGADNATSGIWEFGVPIPSFAQVGIPASIVQPGTNATPGGTRAAFTQNASSPNDPIGTADVDGGRTTLFTPVYDMSMYVDPVISYSRWFTNEMGSNPNTKNFDVFMTNNGGATWLLVERTRRSDRSWRRNVVRVADLMPPTSTVQLRFVAQDPNPGAVVEAAIDDIRIFDLVPATNIAAVANQLTLLAYPNPASRDLNLRFELESSDAVQISLRNTLGQIVYQKTEKLDAGLQQLQLPVADLARGMYILEVRGTQQTAYENVILK